MRNKKAFFVVVSVLLIVIPSEHALSVTLEYSTTAEALAEVGWHDYFSYYSDGDHESKEATNARSYATAFYDEIQFMGEVGISASADASVEPNEINLSAGINGSYYFDIGWVLMDYFYQDANSAMNGWLQIDEFPDGAPCRLQVDISFPNSTWTGGALWQFYMESSLESFLAGRDSLGDYGALSGNIDAFAGEPVFVFLGIAGGGYADHTIETLGNGTLTINATLKAIPHPADFNTDGWINFVDFALLSLNWQRQGCDDPNTDFCQQADFNHSGIVDANDLKIFTQYWLLFYDPNRIQ
jgi:hypothetical protein